jgi:nicotinamide-nucleotide amidase
MKAGTGDPAVAPTSHTRGTPKAWILSIGNELLIGRIVNTNAAWLARMLSILGFNVARIITVPDEIDDIVEELQRGMKRSRLIVTTGGLGPTYDDKTLEAVAKATGRNLVLNQEALRMVKEFYSQRGLELTPERRKMAMMPVGAEALPNPVGAAPGVLLDLGNVTIVSLPGVPSEMKAIFEEHIVPRIRHLAPPRALIECSLIIKGVPESTLAPVLKELAKKNPDAYIKSHPKGHEVLGPILDVRVLAGAADPAEAEERAKNITRRIAEEAVRLGGRLAGESCGTPA